MRHNILGWLIASLTVGLCRAGEIVLPSNAFERDALIPVYYRTNSRATGKGSLSVRWSDAHGRVVEDRQIPFELIDETGGVVAAWSDDKMFMQMLTSFTLDSGELKTFTADMPLQDRSGQQLNGTYEARAFLTTSGPLPPSR